MRIGARASAPDEITSATASATPTRSADTRPITWPDVPLCVQQALTALVATGDVNAGPTWVVDTPDGKVPYQSWAFEQRKQNVEKYIDPNVACLSSGVPRMLYTPGDITIAQTKDAFVLQHSRSHTFRVIPTGSAPRARSDRRRPSSVRLSSCAQAVRRQRATVNLSEFRALRSTRRLP